jgi:hypothetical protein
MGRGMQFCIRTRLLKFIEAEEENRIWEDWDTKLISRWIVLLVNRSNMLLGY